MNYEITCPYCFNKFKDDEVWFRSEKVNHGESEIIPDEYDDVEDFKTRYRRDDKEFILSKYRDWEFFCESEDSAYEAFWRNFNGTTESNPVDDVLHVKAFHRKVIDPQSLQHQRYLKKQGSNHYLIRDEQGMVAQIELVTGEKCSRRVCPHCHNPLPDNYGKNSVKFATVIGITGAGKTVYLSLLHQKMRAYVVKVGLNAIVNNTGARAFLENNMVAAKEPLPGSTPAARFQQPLFYELVRDAGARGRITETFVLYDVAGEVFTDPVLVQKFAPFIEHANGMIMLIDPMQFNVISGTVAGGKPLDEPTAVLDIIHNIVSHGRAFTKCRIPVAVCISKIDTQEVQRVLSDELRRLLLNDVRADLDSNGFSRTMFHAKDYNPIAKELTTFIQNNELVLAQQMQTNYSDYAYFAFTALGCDVLTGEHPNGEKYRYPVGPVLPKRVEEPILWLFHKLGYIGVNERLFSPVKEIIICEKCGSDNVYELRESEQVVTTGWGPFKKKRIVRYACRECGKYFS